MRLLVSDIKAARSFEEKEALDPTSLLGQPPAYLSFRQPIEARVHANVSGSDIIVSGHVSTRMAFNCGRCLENFERVVEGDFQQVVPLSQEFIDVTDDIRETIFIDLPLYPVCREGCRGICPGCGKNRNATACACAATQADPRWDALKKFRFH